MKLAFTWSKKGLWWVPTIGVKDRRLQIDVVLGIVRDRYLDDPDVIIYNLVFFKARLSVGWLRRKKVGLLDEN